MSRNRPLRFDSLETKQLLSGVHHHLAAPSQQASPGVILDGSVTASAESILQTLQLPQSSDAPPVEYFSGRVRSMGPVQVAITAVMSPDGSTFSQGSMDLSNAQGSVHLTYGHNDRISVSPKTGKTVAHYMVAYGTGAYAAAKGEGTWSVWVTPRGQSPTIHLSLHSTKS